MRVQQPKIPGLGVIARLLNLSRASKRVLQVSVDIALLSLSFALALMLRLESWSAVANIGAWYAFASALPVTLLLFARLGFYHAIIRFISERALATVFFGVVSSGVTILLISQAFGLPVPRSVPVIYALLAFLSVGSIRFLLRAIFLQAEFRQKDRVVIFGAGAAGRQLLRSLRNSAENTPVAFVDDDLALHGSTIGGMRVFATSEIASVIKQCRAQIVVLAVPSASRHARADILHRLAPLPVHVRTIPGIADMVNGRADIEQMHEVGVEDLLGRDPVPPLDHLLDVKIRGKTVLVSGAGGSIGSELCRQILKQNPRRLVLLESCEFALYAIDEDLRQLAMSDGAGTAIVPLLGSVQDGARVKEIFGRFDVQTVFHAAAYKHVPLVEHNAAEGIRNNVFGTLTMAKAAVAAGVSDFTLISTDKAVRPTNVMGASKRMAELVCQALALEQTETRFSMVRFGNVLGSSGSVIPLFRRQIAEGGPLTVTHPDITRFFMTIPEAVQLVIQAGAMGKGGDVFLLDMGEPVRIADLASQMIRLSGLEPVFQSGDASTDAKGGPSEIAIQFTGLRPGEKLFEELLINGGAEPSAHEKIMRASEVCLPWRELKVHLDALHSACDAADIVGIRTALRDAPIWYAPESAVLEYVSEKKDAAPFLASKAG